MKKHTVASLHTVASFPTVASLHTVATLIEVVYQQFASSNLHYGHGTDNAWDEAVALVLRVTGALDQESSLEVAASISQAEKCLALADQRVQTRQPLAYVLGWCRYMGFEFEIQPGVVVPRSPIGFLLQEGLSPWLPRRVERIVDLCSGSGSLGIVAAHLFPAAEVTLVELDPVALQVAQRNVLAHKLQDRVTLVAGDVTGPLMLGSAFDLVITNPPYVNAIDMSALPSEFRAEPEAGLAAGEDGLAIINEILAQLPQWLAPAGLFVAEVGASAPALITAHPQLGFIWPDLPLGGEGVFLLEADELTSHTLRRG